MVALIALIASITGIINNVAIISGALVSLTALLPYLKVGSIYLYKGVKYVVVKAADGTKTAVVYVKSKFSKKDEQPT